VLFGYSFCTDCEVAADALHNNNMEELKRPLMYINYTDEVHTQCFSDIICASGRAHMMNSIPKIATVLSGGQAVKDQLVPLFAGWGHLRHRSVRSESEHHRQKMAKVENKLQS
jgi:hypothetical protein